MKLRELKAEIRGVYGKEAPTVRNLWFDCPSCRGKFFPPITGVDGQPVVVEKDHPIRVPFDESPSEAPPIWKREAGTTVDDLTLSPSVRSDPCGVHVFVRKGEIVEA